MKKLFSLLAAVLFAGSMMAAVGNLYYTATFLKGTSANGDNISDYTKTGTYTTNGMSWTIPGNNTNGDYIRIGGKSLNNVDRSITSQAVMGDDIAKLVISHAGISRTDVSVPKVTVTVASDADFQNDVVSTVVTAENGDYALAKSTAGTIEILPASGKWNKDSYYKITFTVSNSSSSNGGLDVKSLAFYSYLDASAPSITAEKVNFDLCLTQTGSVEKTAELVVTGANLTNAITYSVNGANTSVTGDLTTTGGTLNVKFSANADGEYSDTIILTSGTLTQKVAVEAVVLTTAGNGSKEAPFSVADVVKINNRLPLSEKYWVQGYMVGCAANGGELAASLAATNVALGDAADQTKNCVPVELPSGDIRTALNLVDHADYVGRQVKVYGQLISYFLFTGVKAISDYELIALPTPGLEPATFYGATSFITEGTNAGIWTAVEYNITRKADKTLAFELTWTGDVVGIVPQLKIGEGGFTNMAVEGKKATMNPEATYEDDATVNVEFYLAYAGAAKSIPVSYIVGATNEKPETPKDLRMKGAYKIGGEGADYAKLSDAITALETNGMSGDVDLLICADLAESVNVGITNNTNYTLTIRPDKAEKRTIQYGDQDDNAGPSGHILVGALMAKDFNTTLATKNVWFDGSVDGEGQYLEIRAGAVGGRTVVFYGDVTNSGIKNCRIINPRATGTNYAVEIRTEQNTDKRPVGIVIENNYIEDNGSANTQAIQFNGSKSATADGKPKDVVIRNNEIVANLRCIFFNGAENAVIEGNTFRLAKASAGFLAHGIMGNAQKGTIIVRGNKFLELGTMNVSAGEYGICGITASGNADVWVIENNVFAGLDAKADVAGKIVTLRYVRCGDSCVVRNNTFHLPAQTYKPATDLVAAQAVTCLWLAGTKLYIAENNLLVSEETEANNSLIRGALNENVKNNVFFHKGGNAAVLAGAVVAKTWEEFAALEGTAGSKWTEPKFADAANGDFAIAEYNENLIVPRSEAVLKDIENKDRRENTYAGAYEGPDKSPGDAIDNIELSEGAQKIFRNGEVLIIRDGKTYNMMGQIVK